MGSEKACDYVGGTLVLVDSSDHGLAEKTIALMIVDSQHGMHVVRLARRRDERGLVARSRVVDGLRKLVESAKR